MHVFLQRRERFPYNPDQAPDPSSVREGAAAGIAGVTNHQELEAESAPRWFENSATPPDSACAPQGLAAFVLVVAFLGTPAAVFAEDFGAKAGIRAMLVPPWRQISIAASVRFEIGGRTIVLRPSVAVLVLPALFYLLGFVYVGTVYFH